MSHSASRQPTEIAVTLNAVLAAIENDQPKILCVKNESGEFGLPYGPFDPDGHRTLESGLRDWVTRQTSVSFGYVEQLYTFGDKGRETPAAAFSGSRANARLISVGYLALAAKPAAIASKGAQWRNWYEFFPWEDWRAGEPQCLRDFIMPAITRWKDKGDSPGECAERQRRITLAFGLSSAIGWEEERALERYELMYESGLVGEAWRDRRAAAPESAKLTSPPGELPGVTMVSDHRRILATAISRLRGKLKYRPVIYELMPPVFTLLELQKAVETLIGYEMHKQNFRRGVETGGLITKTRRTRQQASGRPAALFKVSGSALVDVAAQGLTIPRLKRVPGA